MLAIVSGVLLSCQGPAVVMAQQAREVAIEHGGATVLGDGRDAGARAG